jgi:hypothetical protein
MKQATSKVLFGVIGIFGTAAAVIPLIIYYFVEANSMNMNGMAVNSAAMDCFGACVAATVIGATVAAIAIVSVFAGNGKLSIGSSAALLAGGVVLIALPQAIGFCKNAEMPCRMITAPILAILGSVIIMLSAVRLLSGIIAARKAEKTA